MFDNGTIWEAQLNGSQSQNKQKQNSPEPDSENKDISLFVNAPSEHDSIHKNFDKMLKCMQALMVCEW